MCPWHGGAHRDAGFTRNDTIRIQLKRNIFEQGFANCILAKDGTESNPGETIGMALVSLAPFITVLAIILMELGSA